ncbi:MAG: hypothetical protein AB7Q42_00150 [Acidimicrobiia bacterium]
MTVYLGGWRGTRSSCTWDPLDASAALDRFERDQPIEKILDGIRYRLYVRTCAATDQLVWIPQRGPGALAFDGRSYLARILPRPEIGAAPPTGEGVAQVGMWFWTSTPWEPMSVTAWVPTPNGAVWATTTATPVRLVVDPGDGGLGDGPLVCDGPGQPWLPEYGDELASTCMYTYRHSSVLAEDRQAFRAGMTIEWDVWWTSSSGAGGELAPIRTTTPTPIVVREIQAIITSP